MTVRRDGLIDRILNLTLRSSYEHVDFGATHEAGEREWRGNCIVFKRHDLSFYMLSHPAKRING